MQTQAAWDQSPQTLLLLWSFTTLECSEVEKPLSDYGLGDLSKGTQTEDEWSPAPLLLSLLYSEGHDPQPHPPASPQLPFAVLPILTFTSMPALMQEFANGR